MKPFWVGLAATFLASSVAFAQLALPGSAPTDSRSATGAEGAAAPASKPKPRARPKPAAPAVLAPAAAPNASPLAALDKPLRQNGDSGELRLVQGPDKSLEISRFSMMGEGVSHPEQKCKIEIVAESPIPAVAQGSPAGAPRYSAAIAACPLTFDLIDGAALVPSQSNACVFSAADCQASPSGLWGPETNELQQNARAIEKARASADRSIGWNLRVLEAHGGDTAASLQRQEGEFASQRDEICRDYVGERRFGYCASRLAEARAARLAQNAAAAGPAAPPSHKKAKKR